MSLLISPGANILASIKAKTDNLPADPASQELPPAWNKQPALKGKLIS